MFANKVLISLALIAAVPSALSRHVRTWENRVFPDDLVRKFPPGNIEDLHISRGDVFPDVETQPDFGEDETQDRNGDDGEPEEVPNFDDDVSKARAMDVHPRVEQVAISEDEADNEKNYPSRDEVIVPEEDSNEGLRKAVVIRVPSDYQSQNYPEYNEDTENRNEDVQTWDDDEDSNNIPEEAPPSRKGWNPW